jgi:hypothetical protein
MYLLVDHKLLDKMLDSTHSIHHSQDTPEHYMIEILRMTLNSQTHRRKEMDCYKNECESVFHHHRKHYNYSN